MSIPPVIAAQPLCDRDLRFDFFRGVALLIIFSDHIRYNPWTHWSPLSLGLADMADLFVFVSGYVCGKSYARRIDRDGLAATQVHALRRGVVLLLAWLITAISLMTSSAISDGLYITSEGVPYNTHSWTTWSLIPQFLAPVGTLNILLLYSLWILPLPLLLDHQRVPRWALPLLSISAYLFTQWQPSLTALPDTWQREWYFHPGGWQLLFYLGAWLAVTPLLRQWLSSTIAAVSSLVVAMALCGWGFWRWPEGLPFTGKATLQPVRLLHFASMVVVITRVTPLEFGPRIHLLCTPIIRCGQHSLLIFCSGVVLSAEASRFVGPSVNPERDALLFMVTGWGLLTGLAMVAHQIRSNRNSSSGNYGEQERRSSM